MATNELQAAWDALQAVPSYVETQAARFASSDLSQLVAQAMDAPHPVLLVWMEDPIIHTVKHPYCTDPDCPCWQNVSYTEFVRGSYYRYREFMRRNHLNEHL